MPKLATIQKDQRHWLSRKENNIYLVKRAGYIGSHTTVELLNAGFDDGDDFQIVLAVLERLERLQVKKFPFYQGSILDTDFWIRFFTNEDIELVIHFAAFKAMGDLFKNL